MTQLTQEEIQERETLEGKFVKKDLYEVGEIPPLGHVPKKTQ